MNLFPKAVVALAGARDHYQLPLALAESGLLHALVTDFYWPADRKWTASIRASRLGRRLRLTRYCRGIDSHRVKVSKRALAAFSMMKVAPWLRLNRYKDRALSVEAKGIAMRDQAALFCYSYYAFEAFKPNRDCPPHRYLFQLHPHPKAVRKILLEELERTPQARVSLMHEHEVSLSAAQFDELAAEPMLANGWVVASSYTASSLAEYGVPAHKTHLVPYGVQSDKFNQRDRPPSSSMPFTIAFVGSLVQRKGLSYLLDAVRLLGSKQIRLVLCGRGAIDDALIAAYSGLGIDVRIGLTREQLVAQLHRADVFVLPSLAEGFGHVFLEAMSCGLPVIGTRHTCVPDVITEGIQGFIVPIRSGEAIAERLAWGIDHRSELAEMGKAAAAQARLFTWERFRQSLVKAYRELISSPH